LAADEKQQPVSHGGCFSSTESDIFLSVLTGPLVCGTKAPVPAAAAGAPPFLHYSSGKVSIPFIIYVLEIFAKA